ncbi:MAG: hypothetical protein LAP85_29245 [Acidobacteriia bacterium]|nr:hypothetical protein [Terriglobia bacterium]
MSKARPSLHKVAPAAEAKPQQTPFVIDVHIEAEWLEKIGHRLEILGDLMYEEQGELGTSDLSVGIESLVSYFSHEILRYAEFLKQKGGTT